jgi:hypothetical protein
MAALAATGLTALAQIPEDAQAQARTPSPVTAPLNPSSAQSVDARVIIMPYGENQIRADDMRFSPPSWGRGFDAIKHQVLGDLQRRVEADLARNFFGGNVPREVSREISQALDEAWPILRRSGMGERTEFQLGVRIENTVVPYRFFATVNYNLTQMSVSTPQRGQVVQLQPQPSLAPSSPTVSPAVTPPAAPATIGSLQQPATETGFPSPYQIGSIQVSTAVVERFTDAVELTYSELTRRPVTPEVENAMRQSVATQLGAISLPEGATSFHANLRFSFTNSQGQSVPVVIAAPLARSPMGFDFASGASISRRVEQAPVTGASPSASVAPRSAAGTASSSSPPVAARPEPRRP